VCSSDLETDEEAVTYDETDENGRFLIQDLNPDDKYIIEVYVGRPAPNSGEAEKEMASGAEDQELASGAAEPVWDNGTGIEDFEEFTDDPVFDEFSDDSYFDEESDDMPGVIDSGSGTIIIDSLGTDHHSVDAWIQTVSTKNLYDMSGLKEKPYLMRNNLW
jgi:hypothetical protein